MDDYLLEACREIDKITQMNELIRNSNEVTAITEAEYKSSVEEEVKNLISKLKDLKEKKNQTLSEIKKCKEEIETTKISLEKWRKKKENLEVNGDLYKKLRNQNAMIQSAQKLFDIVGLKLDVLNLESDDNVTGTFILYFTNIHPSTVYSITFHNSPTKIKILKLEPENTNLNISQIENEVNQKVDQAGNVDFRYFVVTVRKFLISSQLKTLNSP